MKRFFFLGVCLFMQQPLWGFDTISQAAAYADSMPEFPSIEKSNVLVTAFYGFHKKHAQSMISCLLEKIGIRKPQWSTRMLCSMLSPVVEALAGTPQIRIDAVPSEQFLVIGPLHGSFHSLVRILQEYKKQGYIDEELRISRLHTFLVVNGAIFLGAPYSLEVLTLLGSLIRKNPKTVMYLSNPVNVGQVDMREELSKRGCFSQECVELITQFFKKSPTTLVIGQGKKTKDEIIITASSNLSAYEGREPRTGAFIIPEDRLIDYAIQKGCLLQIPERGMPVWSIFSAPNYLFTKYFHFHYDAYTIITMGSVLRESVIALYNRDIEAKKGFALAMQASVCSGISLDAKGFSFKKIDKKSMITFTSTMDLTGAHKYIGLNMKAGLAAAVRRVNQEGGINGKFLDFFIPDDQYSPQKSRFNIEKSLKEVGPVIVSPVGSATTAASLDLIQEKKIYVLFTNSGSLRFRDPSLTNIINFRASYKSEGRALVAYAYQKLIGRKFAFLVQNDGHGLSALEGAREMLQELGIKEWTEGFYEHNTVNVANAVEIIKKSNPDVIGFFSVVPSTLAFIKQAGESFFINKKLLGMSSLGDKAFHILLKHYGLSATFSHAVPNPETSTLEIAQEYRKDSTLYGITPGTYSFEGYMYGRLAAEIFKKIEGPITPDSLERVIETFKDYPFKGLTLTYNPSNRQLSNDLWLEVSPNEWIKQKV